MADQTPTLSEQAPAVEAVKPVGAAKSPEPKETSMAKPEVSESKKPRGHEVKVVGAGGTKVFIKRN